MKNLYSVRSKLGFLYIYIRNFFSLKSPFSLSLFSAVSVCFLLIFSSFVFAGETTNVNNRTTGNVVGNYCRVCIGETGYSSPNDNVVNVFEDVVGNVTGARGAEDDYDTANNNHVTVIKGTVFENVSGGYAKYSTNNFATIEGGTIIGSVYGGSGDNATGNTVIIKGGIIYCKEIKKKRFHYI